MTPLHMLVLYCTITHCHIKCFSHRTILFIKSQKKKNNRREKMTCQFRYFPNLTSDHNMYKIKQYLYSISYPLLCSSVDHCHQDYQTVLLLFLFTYSAPQGLPHEPGLLSALHQHMEWNILDNKDKCFAIR